MSAGKAGLSSRSHQASMLNWFFGKSQFEGVPVILTADLNTGPDTDAWFTITEKYVDLYTMACEANSDLVVEQRKPVVDYRTTVHMDYSCIYGAVDDMDPTGVSLYVGHALCDYIMLRKNAFT